MVEKENKKHSPLTTPTPMYTFLTDYTVLEINGLKATNRLWFFLGTKVA